VGQQFGEARDGVRADAGENVLEPEERVHSHALAGGYEAAQDGGRPAPFVATKEHPVGAANRHAADGALGGIMPPPGLCRAGSLRMHRFRRISGSGVSVTRHNHRLSRKASSESVGRKRAGTALDGVACASAFSLSRMSA
jgi:hypothetical protein